MTTEEAAVTAAEVSGSDVDTCRVGGTQLCTTLTFIHVYTHTHDIHTKPRPALYCMVLLSHVYCESVVTTAVAV